MKYTAMLTCRRWGHESTRGQIAACSFPRGKGALSFSTIVGLVIAKGRYRKVSLTDTQLRWQEFHWERCYSLESGERSKSRGESSRSFARKRHLNAASRNLLCGLPIDEHASCNRFRTNKRNRQWEGNLSRHSSKRKSHRHVQGARVR